MLKSILFGLIALQFGTPVLSRPWDENARVYCLEIHDGLRMSYAMKHEIANMNKLEYDMDLEKILIEEVMKYDGCPEHTFIKTDKYEMYLNINETMLDEFLSGAGRTKLAGFQFRCEQSGSVIGSIAVDTSSAPMLNGEPASRCPSDRSINYAGLCAMPSVYKQPSYARKTSTDIKSVWQDPCSTRERLYDIGLVSYQRKTAVGPMDFENVWSYGCDEKVQAVKVPLIDDLEKWLPWK